jgi:hypothetical protein
VETGQLRTTAAQQFLKGRSWFTLNWRLRLVAIALGLFAVLLDAEWKTIDKYFPKLNEVLHAGYPTSEGDGDYLMAHLQQDMQTLSDPCTDDMTFEQCRARMIANKPVVGDFIQRVTKLDRAWAAEVRAGNVSEACQAEMNEFLAAYKEFVTTERDVLGVLESMNTEDTTKSLMATYNGAEGRDTAAWQAIRRLKRNSACNGY